MPLVVRAVTSGDGSVTGTAALLWRALAVPLVWPKINR
jgi:hypothetical protein